MEVPEEQAADIVDLVRSIRATRGLTQEGLARQLGVSFATVNGWENGRHRPMPALARRLAALAGTGGTKVDDAPVEPGALTSPPRAQRPQIDDGGWSPHPRERRDFLHRVREFPQEVARWRGALVRTALENPDRFPAVQVVAREARTVARRQGGDPDQATVEAVRAVIDDVTTYLREVAKILALLHGTPDLGNKSDPVDELVYIILSRKTREEAYQAAFAALKSRFATWDDLLTSSTGEVSSSFSGPVDWRRRRRPACSVPSRRSESASDPARSSLPGHGPTRNSRRCSARCRRSTGRAPTA